MNKRLIILSDLWGAEKAQTYEPYQTTLSEFYDVTFYDCRELAGLSDSPSNEEQLHKQFVEEGIDTAVKNLLAQETEQATILAFSMGGAIAWKGALQSLRFDKMFFVSATRLRLEERKPLGRISLFYGKEDADRPDEDWVARMNLRTELIPKGEHDIYKGEEFAKYLCGKVFSK